MSHARISLWVLAAVSTGCTADEPVPVSAPTPEGPSETVTTREGPVEATVTLTPKAPRLGDSARLQVLVTAEPGVTVDMPPFGEVLGRFQVVDFAPRQGKTADGKTEHEHVYTLQAQMSGRQRLPSMRIEFTDARPNQSSSELKELLTEEIDVAVESVVPEGAVADTLRGPKGALEDSERAAIWRRWVVAVGITAILAVIGFVVRRVRKRAHRVAEVLAHERALARLAALGGQVQGDADPFYVELSSVVRHYLEDRFRLRAPELTTEEFLREARRSSQLTDEQRQRLSGFLAVCDRVKFAGYEPPGEQREADLSVARQFVLDTTASVFDAGEDRAA